MAIDENTAKAVANLARLELAEAKGQSVDPERLAALVEEFSKIVGYMDILSEAQTDGVEPLYSPMIDPQPPRSDQPVENHQKADAILDQAPERIGRYFSVPRIF
ncbi:MAG: Asp-tRNA(Asn)/Glu-tRNA(Gln) amidotransferase subunit GatC [Deltaproteobacteria bacterium]|jgi:aspartyl-tRNA(Asn)/glutamyl-tRNA(Gln) amidotransferase subunit C|nr:Asp-tRNA(Asn)/Glu-tRNA(Gln) amidotransferase subunit GatC [Deltaproteobacteria bacterium]